MKNTCEPFSETFLPLQSQLKAQTELWEKWDFLIGGFEWHTKKTGNPTCILENASKMEEGWSNQVTCSMGELDCNTPNIRAGLKYPKSKGKWGVCNTRFPLEKKTDNIVIACSFTFNVLELLLAHRFANQYWKSKPTLLGKKATSMVKTWPSPEALSPE